MYAAAGSNVGAFFRAQAEEATHSHWQIIQVAEASSPGLSAAEPMWLQPPSLAILLPTDLSQPIILGATGLQD